MHILRELRMSWNALSVITEFIKNVQDLIYLIFLSLKRKKINFMCQFCVGYTFQKHDKHVSYRHNTALCKRCDKWLNQKCADLNKTQYNERQKEES